MADTSHTITFEKPAKGIHRVTDGYVNAWLVVDGDAITVIDAGLPAHLDLVDAALAELGRRREDVEVLLLTHAHADHVGAAPALQRAGARGPGTRTGGRGRDRLAAPPVGGADGSALDPASVAAASLPVRHARHGVSGFLAARGPLNVDAVAADGALALPGQPVPVPTPGHTDRHCSYLLPERGALFTGDALVTLDVLTGAQGPRTMPPVFSLAPERAAGSLRQLAELDAEVILPGHGEPLVASPGAAIADALAASAP